MRAFLYSTGRFLTLLRATFAEERASKKETDAAALEVLVFVWYPADDIKPFLGVSLCVLFRLSRIAGRPGDAVVN